MRGGVVIQKSQLMPWSIVLEELLSINADKATSIVDKTGMKVDWTLSEKENYSHTTRLRAYKPRIQKAFNALSEQDQLRVIHIICEELLKDDGQHGENIEYDLQRIGWTIQNGNIIPNNESVTELFFKDNTHYDAYLTIRGLLQKCTNSLDIIDPYFGSKILQTISTIQQNIKLRIFLSKKESDFLVEVKNFSKQYSNINIEVKKTKEFHDRFIIIDEKEVIHIGTSIKDAGNKIFMINKIEDIHIIKAIIDSFNDKWTTSDRIYP